MRLITCRDIENKIFGVVTSNETWNLRTREPNPQGLFSYEIFGKTPLERSTRFGKIVLPISVLHPFVFDLLKVKKQKIIQHMLLLKPWTYDNEIRLFESEEDARKNGFTNPYYGITALIQNYNTVLKLFNLPEIQTLLEKYDDKILIDCIPVVPPQFRGDNPDVVHPLTDLYIRLIKSTYSAKKVEQNPTDKDVGSFFNTFQRQVYDIYVGIIESVKGKNGIVKRMLLGKRHDYTGRSVVAPDYELPPTHLKVSIRILVKIFEPYIIKALKNEYPLNKLIQLINTIYYNQDTRKLYDRDKDIRKVIDTLIDVCKEKYVLMKRDPVIHRLGIQAFRVIPDFDNVTKVSPVITKGFNMDFDGDTAAIFTVYTDEAQHELRKLANPYSSSTVTKLKYSLEKEYAYTFKVVTINNFTKDEIEDLDDDLKELYKQTEVFGIKTTVGRKKLFELLDKEYQTKELFEILYPNNKEYLDGNDVLTNLQIELDNSDLTVKYLTKIMLFLNDYIPLVSEVITLDNLLEASKIKKYVEEKFLKLKSFEEKVKFIEEIKKKVYEELKHSNIGKLVRTNSVKKVQLLQLLVAKGTYRDILGKEDVSYENLATGLSENQLYVSGNIARYGIAARTIKVAEPGRIFKDMSYLMSSLRLSKDVEDCGTHRLLTIENVDKETVVKIFGRTAIVDNQEITISSKNYKDLIGKTIYLRSPMYCKAENGICLKCYGQDLYNKLQSTEIGLLAANSIGERLYQEIMKVFHVAGHTELKRLDFEKFVLEKLDVDKILYHRFFVYDKDNYTVKANTKVTLVLSRELYQDVYKALFGENNDDIQIDNPVFTVQEDIDSNSQYISLLIPGTISLNISDDVDIQADSDSIYLTYEKGMDMFTVELSSFDVNTSFQLVYHILLRGHKLQVTDSNLLLNHFVNSLKGLGTVDNINAECVLAMLLRDSENPYKQARLGEPYKPELYNIYSCMKYENILLNGFRSNLRDSIIRSVVSGVATDSESTLNKLAGLS